MAGKKERELRETERLVLEGKIPPGTRLGVLNFSKMHSRRLQLPEGLQADGINFEESAGLHELPAGLRVRWLRIAKCPNISTLPGCLQCDELQAAESGLREIPSTVRVAFRLELTGCTGLTRLGSGCGAKSIHLGGCSSLLALPPDIDASFLTISGCTSLTGWPPSGRLSVGSLNMRECPQLTAVPPWMGALSQLNLSGCAGVRSLPDDAQVTSWIDVAGTQLQSLPRGCQGAALRWRGVFVDQQIAFHPESITAAQVLAEHNTEIRRVLLERMGYVRFMEQAEAEVLDHDRDAGGERRLLLVPMKDDEDLVCIMVRCPSTGRRYMIRVPPTVRTCSKAVAWIGGFDEEEKYKPLVET